MRSAEEPAGVLLRPCSCGRGGTLQKRTPPRCFTLAGVALASWKRTPPCCCALAGVAALCRSARRRAVVLWLAWRSAETHAAVLLCPPDPAPRSSSGGSKPEAGVIPPPCCPGASCAGAGRRAPAASSQGRRALGAKRRLGGARAAQLKLSG